MCGVYTFVCCLYVYVCYSSFSVQYCKEVILLLLLLLFFLSFVLASLVSGLLLHIKCYTRYNIKSWCIWDIDIRIYDGVGACTLISRHLNYTYFFSKCCCCCCCGCFVFFILWHMFYRQYFPVHATTSVMVVFYVYVCYSVHDTRNFWFNHWDIEITKPTNAHHMNITEIRCRLWDDWLFAGFFFSFWSGSRNSREHLHVHTVFFIWIQSICLAKLMKTAFLFSLNLCKLLL